MKKFIKITMLPLVLFLLLSSCQFGNFKRAFSQGAHPDSRSNGITAIQSPEIENPASYKFCVFSDMHINKNGLLGYYDAELPDRLITFCAENNIDFAVNLGDFTEYGQKKDYDDYLTVLNKFRENGIQHIYTCTGNHDMYNNGWNYYKEYVSPCPESSSPAAFTFTIENHSYYFLDNASGTFGTNQYKSLKKKFAADSNVKTVFAHYPIIEKSAAGVHDVLPSEAECAAFKELFSTSNVDYYFSGHVHTHLETKFKNFMHYNVECAYASKNNLAKIIIVSVENGKIEKTEVVSL